MATRDQYNTNGLPLAPRTTPYRTPTKPPPKTSGEDLQWKGDVPQPSMGNSALGQAVSNPSSPTQVTQQTTPEWKNPDGQSVVQTSLGSADKPIFRNDIIDPKLNKEYGYAIYSGGKGFTEQSATTSGLDSAMQNAKRNTPFGEATGAQDFYDGQDVSKLTPQQFSQFKVDDAASVRDRRNYASELKAYTRDTTAPDNFLVKNYLEKPKPYEDTYTDLERDVRGLPRNGQPAPRSELLADEARQGQQKIAELNAANAPNNRELDKKYPAFKSRPVADDSRPAFDKELMSSMSVDPKVRQTHIDDVTARQARYDQLLATDQKLYDKNMKVTRLLMKQHRVSSPSELQGLVSDDEWDQFVSPLLSETAGYAEGGVVQPPVYGGAPTNERALSAVNSYREYAVRANSMGLPVVPFEQFTAMQSGALQGQPTGYARGGMVEPEGDEFGMPMQGEPEGDEYGMPQSALGGAQGQGGKFVMDMNPNAPTDSVPATVDGAQPARLNSGEFVLPTDVVQFFGLDRLNRMIAQARKSSGEAPQ